MWLLRLLSKAAKPTLHLMTCQLHGSRYYECLQLIDDKQLKNQQRLQLQREPDNPYDRNAVAVYTLQQQKLGYLPKKHNLVIANLMDQKCQINVNIENISPTAWEPLTLYVSIQL